MNTSTLSKLIVGIDPSCDVVSMLDDGIKQFYFGYLDTKYEKTYASQTSLNRRYRKKEQYNNIEDIYKTIDTIHQHGGIIHLALNSFSNNNTMKEEALKQFELFCDKVDAIIVANISMAIWLKELGYKQIVSSNLFGVYSKEGVAYLQEAFAPTKIILPRDISLEDIEDIVSHFPQQDFECFLYGDSCRYSESFCFVEHGYDSVGFGSLCSFAQQNRLPVSTPTPAYKHIVKHSKYTLEEKRELLRKKPMDIESLLNTLEIAIFEGDTITQKQTLEILQRYDTNTFLKQKHLFVRASKYLKKLQQITYKPQDSYKEFHKLNNTAIAKTIDFFKQFENIISYKIPSRGREHYRFFLQNDTSAYNYKESQYKL